MKYFCSRLSYFFALFLLIASFSSQINAEEVWNTKVTPSRNILDWGETFTLHIEIDYPENYTPNMFEFLQKQKRSEEGGFFRFQAGTYEEKTGHLSVYLAYEPLVEGTLVCVPGALSFYSQEGKTHHILFRSQEASLVPSEKNIEMAPLVDESPEGKINLSQKNRHVSFFAEETLQKEAALNLRIMASHTFAWTLFTLSISTLAALFCIFWYLREPFTTPKKKKKTYVKRNWRVEYNQIIQLKKAPREQAATLTELLRDKLSSLEKRPLQGATVSELLHIVAVSSFLGADEKMAVQKILLELEKVQFSPNSQHNEAFVFYDEKLVQFFDR